MKKQDLITKFREFFNGLPHDEQKDLWDIMTALRGEDGGEGEDLKAYTTCRIRGELLGQTGHDGHKHGAYIALSLSQAKSFSLSSMVYSAKRVEDLISKKRWSHWASHLCKAITALKKHRPKKSMQDLIKFECD